jgi:stearoyl-CoA desaturase (delta-9 desaturase)
VSTINNGPPSAPLPVADWHALDERRIRPVHVIPILSVHALCLGVIWTGWSWTAVAVAVVLYVIRMFVITAFYHRYFSHRTFRTHRSVQFIAACIGVSAAQRGPLWWAAHHREHHRHSDEEPDLHSPWWRGVLWSHTGWFLTQKGQATNWKAIPDWTHRRELLWVERNHVIGPFVLVAALAALGWALSILAPALGAGLAQLVVWGFGISTTALYHATFTINSLAHTIGSRRFRTGDDSRNNWFLALLTLGEGWHNNHHFHPGSARQGFYWWEYDPAYWILRVMSWAGLVWDLRPVPAWVYERAEKHPRSGVRGAS